MDTNRDIHRTTRPFKRRHISPSEAFGVDKENEDVQHARLLLSIDQRAEGHPRRILGQNDAGSIPSPRPRVPTPPQQPVSSSQEEDQESSSDEDATQVSAHDDPDHNYTFSVEQYAKKKVCQNALLDKHFTQELKAKKKPQNQKTTAGNYKKLEECLARMEARAAFAMSKYKELYQEHSSLVDETNTLGARSTKITTVNETLQREMLSKTATLATFKAASTDAKGLANKNSNKIKRLTTENGKKDLKITRLQERLDAKPKGLSKNELDLKKMQLKNESLLIQQETQQLDQQMRYQEHEHKASLSIFIAAEKNKNRAATKQTERDNTKSAKSARFSGLVNQTGQRSQDVSGIGLFCVYSFISTHWFLCIIGSPLSSIGTWLRS
jgi:hypothetical protein